MNLVSGEEGRDRGEGALCTIGMSCTVLGIAIGEGVISGTRYDRCRILYDINLAFTPFLV